MRGQSSMKFGIVKMGRNTYENTLQPKGVYNGFGTPGPARPGSVELDSALI